MFLASFRNASRFRPPNMEDVLPLSFEDWTPGIVSSSSSLSVFSPMLGMMILRDKFGKCFSFSAFESVGVDLLLREELLGLLETFPGLPTLKS